MEISYDPEKRQRTLDARGIDFEDAPAVFAGFTLTRPDRRRDYGEVREVTVGRLGTLVVVIVWTERSGRRRIISMRKASVDERDRYHAELERSG